jgi:hypothetical protein
METGGERDGKWMGEEEYLCEKNSREGLCLSHAGTEGSFFSFIFPLLTMQHAVSCFCSLFSVWREGLAHSSGMVLLLLLFLLKEAVDLIYLSPLAVRLMPSISTLRLSPPFYPLTKEGKPIFACEFRRAFFFFDTADPIQ